MERSYDEAKRQEQTHAYKMPNFQQCNNCTSLLLQLIILTRRAHNAMAFHIRCLQTTIRISSYKFSCWYKKPTYLVNMCCLVWASQTGNKLLIPHPKPEKFYQGKNTSMPKLKEAIKEEVTRGRELLQSHCNFNVEAFRPSCADSTYGDQTDDKEEKVEDVALDEESSMVTVYEETMNFDTAV